MASKSQKPVVSKVQCLDANTNDLKLYYITMGTNEWEASMDLDQEKYIDKLVEETVDPDKPENLLIFPPHGNTPVK